MTPSSVAACITGWTIRNASASCLFCALWCPRPVKRSPTRYHALSSNCVCPTGQRGSSVPRALPRPSNGPVRWSRWTHSNWIPRWLRKQRAFSSNNAKMSRLCKALSWPTCCGPAVNRDLPATTARPHWVSQLGDARRGKFVGNLMAFGRALRRAGLPVDAARMALAQQALMRIGPVNKVDVASALECVLVNRHQDRDVFREMFQAFFKDPELAHRLLAHTVPQSAAPKKNQPRPRALAALSSAARPPADRKSTRLNSSQ